VSEVPPPTRLEIGITAETQAAAHLAAAGLRIVARNLRCKAGELDIVALDGELLVIVEVRLRSRADYGGALASVTVGKQRRLIRATLFHCQRQPDWRARRVRFDVVALGRPASGMPEFIWIKDAFRAG
jgi:putative endonuclease